MNKKQLYESIMLEASKIVKQSLNEKKDVVKLTKKMKDELEEYKKQLIKKNNMTAEEADKFINDFADIVNIKIEESYNKCVSSLLNEDKFVQTLQEDEIRQVMLNKPVRVALNLQEEPNQDWKFDFEVAGGSFRMREDEETGELNGVFRCYTEQSVKEMIKYLAQYINDARVKKTDVVDESNSIVKYQNKRTENRKFKNSKLVNESLSKKFKKHLNEATAQQEAIEKEIMNEIFNNDDNNLLYKVLIQDYFSSKEKVKFFEYLTAVEEIDYELADSLETDEEKIGVMYDTIENNISQTKLYDIIFNNYFGTKQIDEFYKYLVKNGYINDEF